MAQKSRANFALPAANVTMASSLGGFRLHGYPIGVATLAPSGYCAGVVSPKNAAYNGRGESASILSSSGFSFGGAWFTAAFNTGLSIRIEGIRNAASVFDESFLVNMDIPYFFAANWLDLDELRFSASGGVDAGHGFTGTTFAMDDIYLTPTSTEVPEPATAALMTLGLIGLVVVRRRSLMHCRAGAPLPSERAAGIPCARASRRCASQRVPTRDQTKQMPQPDRQRDGGRNEAKCR